MTNPQTTISVTDFASLINSNSNVTIVDVRTKAEIDNEFLEGCLNVPLQDITAATFESAVAHCDTADTIYLLCGSGLRAQKATEQLQGTIANPLVVVSGGIQAMKQAGISLKKGRGNVISLERQVRITAGSLVVLGVILGSLVTPGLYGLSAFVGIGLIFSGVTDTCGMGMIMARMPWNRSA